MSDDTPLQRALMRNTARLRRPEAEAWAVGALERPAESLVWLDPDEAYDLRDAFLQQRHAAHEGDEALDVAVDLETRDPTGFDDGLRLAAPFVEAASAPLVWLLPVPGHGVLVAAEDVLSRTRAMIRQDDFALEVLSRDQAVGLYADIDTFAGHTPPDYMICCWRVRASGR